MLKKNQLIFVFVLVVLVSGAFAQVALDIIYRDFPVTAYGFEEFMGCDDEGNSNSTKVRFTNEGYTTDGNGTELRYGKCNNGRDNGKKGYKNGPDLLSCEGWEWDNPIKVTLGMVGPKLFYDKANCDPGDIQEDPDGQNREEVVYRYCARPVAGNDNCSSKLSPGNKIEQWFSSGREAKEIRDAIELTRKGDNYVIEYNYNTETQWNDDSNGGKDNGFFPLDKYDGKKDNNGNYLTWNRQSFNMWCDNRNYPDNDCSRWGNFNLPNDNPARNPNAAIDAAKNNSSLKKKLHNYGFSAAGSGQFKYDASQKDIFKFIGDDDMWIFIDGELVADLGGVHLAAPANINIQNHAYKKNWKDGSTHVVNFFYMDRNTDGSNFKLEMKLSGLAAARFGAPAIKKAETEQKTDGSSSTVIYVNNKLDETSIRQFISGEGKDLFPIVIKKGDNNLYGFKLEEISGPKSTSEGYAYIITGKVCSNKTNCGAPLIINSGDSLSFNVLYDDLKNEGKPFDGLELPDERWYIKTANTNAPATKVNWALNTTSMPSIVFKPDIADNDVKKPNFPVDDWFTGNPNGGKGNGGGQFSVGGSDLGTNFGNTKGLFPSIRQIWDNKKGELIDLPNGRDNNTVHGFGTKGTPIPLNRTGELILTAYPNASSNVNGKPYSEWYADDSVSQKLFGLPPMPKDDKLFGIADPTVPQTYGGYMFVKNGFKEESSVGGIQVAPTRCIADRDVLVNGKAPRINCLNFSLTAKQPFQLSVTVYDQLGNFVTQYRETVNETEFRSVVQGPTFIEQGSTKPSSGSSGYVQPTNKGQSNECDYPTSQNDFGKKNIITTNGLVKVNVNIYPFSKDGRRFGNGVYILKIDRVDFPYEGCMNSAGSSLWIEEKFVRYHADTKFGWMRTTK